MESCRKISLTSNISNSPHSPFLWVIRRLLFVGRNSNPSSFQGLSNFAVPGIPKGLTSVEANSDVLLVFEEVFGRGVINDAAALKVENSIADESLI